MMTHCRSGVLRRELRHRSEVSLLSSGGSSLLSGHHRLLLLLLLLELGERKALVEIVIKERIE